MWISSFKKFFIILGLALTCMPAFSQSMTDDQVIEYVRKEQEKGRTQQQIVSNLLKRGVTPDQLRRIRKKYESEKDNLGASDLTAKDSSIRCRINI